MSDHDEYEFHISVYTPATFPLERLAKYAAALAKLFGSTPNVHFKEIKDGSTVPVLSVDLSASETVAQRIHGVATGEAANDAFAAFNDLNKLLGADTATGTLSRRSASSQNLAVVLKFLGKNLPEPTVYAPFTEPASIDGELVRIGGMDTTSHAHLVDAEGHSWHAEVSRDMATILAQYLYKGQIVRLHGDARWSRLEDGSWKLNSFRAHEIQILESASLDEAVGLMRELRPTDWSSLEDIEGHIKEQRGGDVFH